MEERKNKSNILIIILFILLLIAVGIICYLLGSSSVKESGKNSENTTEHKENSETSDDNLNEEETTITPTAYTPLCPPNNQQNLQVDIDETKYNDIVDYIQAQKNIEITLSYCDDDPATEDIEIGSYTLNKSEKNSVLKEMKNSDYYLSDEGIGGVCVASMNISYERNSKKYEVNFYQLFAMTSSNDGNIYKILDKNLAPMDFCNYEFRNLSSTASSILNNLQKS